MAQTAQPLLVELDERTRSEELDRVEPWLATVATLQATFRKLLEDTVDDVHEPHLHEGIADVLAAARAHEDQVDDLYRAFGRAPAGRDRLGSVTASLVARTRELVGHVEGLAGGARGNSWRNTRQLLLTNLDSLGGFAVAQQLGLALGIPAVVEIAYPIIHRKSEDQLYLQEVMLEMATNAILYHRDI